MKCPNCGFESNDNLNFCGACGYRLNFTEVGDQEQKGVKNRDQMGVRNWKNYPESSPPPSPDYSYLTPDNDNGKKKNNHKKKKLIFIIVPILLIVLGLFELYLIQSKLKDKTSKTESTTKTSKTESTTKTSKTESTTKTSKTESTTAKNHKLPKNPRIESDSSMKAGQKVTWDCIWFGSYPQTEIVDIPETSGVHGKNWEKETDYEVNASLYNELQNADGWDSNGDLIAGDGIKYRRIKSSDTAFSGEGFDCYYEWKRNSSVIWHYFRYDKIKWRVLNVSGGQALLLSDQALDDQPYYTTYTDVTWDTSTIRSWLNGYGAGSNANGTDYSNKNFIESAFTSAERGVVQTTQVVNDDNISYGIEGGADTSDKVFLLSESEVYTDTAKNYGFVSGSDTADEARRSKSSTYAKAMGTYSEDESSSLKGNCWWWLRSPGRYTNYAAVVLLKGNVMSDGDIVNSNFYKGVRPALNLNLSSSNLWSNAGTVCSDGTVDEIGGENGMEGD